jgi:hypothetical protein
VAKSRADTRYLKRQGHAWSFVMAIPKGLRGRFMSEGRKAKKGQRLPGKPLTKVVASLHTQSLKEAQAQRWPLVHQWRQAFERAAKGIAMTLPEIEAQAREVYLSMLESMEAYARRRKRAPSVEAENLDIVLYEFMDHVRETAGHLPDDFDLDAIIEDLNDFEMVSHELSAAQRRTGITVEPDSETYKILGQAIVRAVIDAMDGRLKALRGQPSQEPATFLGAHGIDKASLRPIASLSRPKIRIRDDSSIRFSEAASIYMDQRQHDANAALTEQTRSQQEAIFRLFEDYTENAPLTAIDRSVASDFLARISQLITSALGPNAWRQKNDTAAIAGKIQQRRGPPNLTAS